MDLYTNGIIQLWLKPILCQVTLVEIYFCNFFSKRDFLIFFLSF